MEHCKFCGAELPEGAAFCPYCARSQLEKQPLSPPAPKRRRMLGGWIAGLLAAGVALCAIGLIWFQPWQKAPNAESHLSVLAETAQTEPPQTEPAVRAETTAAIQPKTEPTEKTEAPEETTVPEETEAPEGTTAPAPTQPPVRMQQENGTRGELKTTYFTGSNGYVEYTELYPNGRWAYHLVSSDGKMADVGVYDEEGNVLERTKTWDVAGAIAARRDSTNTE